MLIRLTGLFALTLLPGGSLRAQSDTLETHAVVLGQYPFQQQRLTESSGLEASRTQHGIFWTLNDSNNPAELFATDLEGKDHGVVHVEGAENVDWEALGLARCGKQDCLYAADVGDNRERRDRVQVYRIPEPRADHDTIAKPSGVLQIRYPDGPHNVEAVLVTANQDVFLIDKTSRNEPAVYKVPGSAWSRGEGDATLIQTLPIPSTQGGRWEVTDAALSHDGRAVAVRTYRYVYFFSFDGNRLTPVETGFRCDANNLEFQGEGIAWVAGDTLATSTERVALASGGISRIVCR